MSKKRKKRDIPVIAGLFDSHAHLDDERFDEDRGEVIFRARSVGVQRILTVDSEPHRIGVSSALAASYPGVYAASGVHPHEASQVDDEVIATVWKQVSETPRVQAVGEIGLDYFYMHSPRQTQIRVFRQMLHLALEVQRPVVVHVRDAHEDAIRILSETDIGRVGGVIHCFSGGPDEAEAYLAMGLFISLSGVVTYKKAETLREVAARLPRDRILIETDSPYLAPGDRRGRRCEPAYVAFTAEQVARVRDIEPRTLAELTRDNGLRLFDIRPVAESVGPLVRMQQGLVLLRVTGRCRRGVSCCDGFGSNAHDRNSDCGSDGLFVVAREPLLSDLLEAVEDQFPSPPDRVLVTGGEPTLRWNLVRSLVGRLREMGVSWIGLDTDGLSALAGQDRILDEIEDLFDDVGICLPAADAAGYAKFCRGPFARKGFDEALRQMRRFRKKGLSVRLVFCSGVNSQARACRRLASMTGVDFDRRGP